MTRLQQTDFQERKANLKLIVIMGVLAFIISVVATMFFTGTFNRNNEQLNTDEVAQIDDEDNKNKSQQLSQTTETQKSNNFNQTEPNKNDTAYIDSKKDNEQADSDNLELAYEEPKIDDGKKNSKETETKYEQLAKVYGSMKAENAAIVMCELEPNLTEKILSKMSERVAGKIMGAIVDKDPSYAAQVSKLLVNAGNI